MDPFFEVSDHTMKKKKKEFQARFAQEEFLFNRSEGITETLAYSKPLDSWST